MKSKRNLDVMKEVLCNRFEKYVRELNEEELFEFVNYLRGKEVLESISQICPPIVMPQEILSCEECEKLYGNCDNEVRKEKDLLRVCKRRFRSYGEAPAK